MSENRVKSYPFEVRQQMWGLGIFLQYLCKFCFTVWLLTPGRNTRQRIRNPEYWSFWYFYHVSLDNWMTEPARRPALSNLNLDFFICKMGSWSYDILVPFKPWIHESVTLCAHFLDFGPLGTWTLTFIQALPWSGFSFLLPLLGMGQDKCREHGPATVLLIRLLSSR